MKQVGLNSTLFPTALCALNIHPAVKVNIIYLTFFLFPAPEVALDTLLKPVHTLLLCPSGRVS